MVSTKLIKNSIKVFRYTSHNFFNFIKVIYFFSTVEFLQKFTLRSFKFSKKFLVIFSKSFETSLVILQILFVKNHHISSKFLHDFSSWVKNLMILKKNPLFSTLWVSDLNTLQFEKYLQSTSGGKFTIFFEILINHEFSWKFLNFFLKFP